MQKYLSLLVRLWKMLSLFHNDFYLQVLSAVVIQMANIYAIYLTAKVLDNIIHKDFIMSSYLVIYILIIALVRVVIQHYSELHAQNNIDFAVQQHLEEYSFKKIFNLNIFQYTEDHSAIKEQVINRGENAVENK